jgi:phosphoglucosamine mutase
VDPNGRNINDACGALYPERTGAKLREVRGDVGIALDGDADRCVMIDERGQTVDGDALLAAARARRLRARHAEGRIGGVDRDEQPRASSAPLARRWARASCARRSGDRYVVEAMRSGGFNLGGEQSGHVVMLDHNTTGDGLLRRRSRCSRSCRRSGRPLSELVAGFERCRRCS